VIERLNSREQTVELPCSIQRFVLEVTGLFQIQPKIRKAVVFSS